MKRATRRAAIGVVCVGLAAAGAALGTDVEAPKSPAIRPTQAPHILPYKTRTGGQNLAYYYDPAAAPRPENGDAAAARLPPGTALPVLFFSDETSWRPLLQGVASDLARGGRHVLGIDAPAYFRKVVDGPAHAADLEYFRAYLNGRARRQAAAPVIVAGMGFSAELVPYVMNRAGTTGVAGLLLIAPDDVGAFIHRASVALGMPSPAGEAFAVAPEFARLPALPIALLQGVEDKKGTARDFLPLLKGAKRLVMIPGGDHEFRGKRDLLSTHVDETLRWLDGIARQPSPGNRGPAPPGGTAAEPPGPSAVPTGPSPTPPAKMRRLACARRRS